MQNFDYFVKQASMVTPVGIGHNKWPLKAGDGVVVAAVRALIT